MSKELQGYFQATLDSIRDDHPNAPALRYALGCTITILKSSHYYKSPLENLQLKAALDVLHKQSGSTDQYSKWVVENVPKPGELANCLVPESPPSSPVMTTPPAKTR